MKKTKILNSFILVALVLSLGSCTVEDESSDTLTDEETSSNASGQLTDSSLVETASNPGQLFQKAAEQGNYSMLIEYDTWESTDPISYEDYLALNYGYATTEQWAAYYNLFLSMYLDTSYLIYLYYNTDYVLVCTYQYNNNYSDGSYSWDLYYIEILVNEDNGTFWNYTYMYNYWTYGCYYYD